MVQLSTHLPSDPVLQKDGVGPHAQGNDSKKKLLIAIVHVSPSLLSGQNLGTHRLDPLSQVFHGERLGCDRHQRDSRRQTRERWRMNLVSHTFLHPKILHLQVPHPPNARPVLHANSGQHVHCHHESEVHAKVTSKRRHPDLLSDGLDECTESGLARRQIDRRLYRAPRLDC